MKMKKYNKGDKITIVLSESDATMFSNGYYNVIHHEVAFDWNTLVPGMAFGNSIYSPIFYIGKTVDGSALFDFTASVHECTTAYDTFGGENAHENAGLYRIEEKDLK